MTRIKKLLILLVVLLLFIAAAFFALQYEEKKEDIKNTGEVIVNINPEEVTALSWDYEGTVYSFHKEDHWVYDDDPDFPVDDNTILEMLSYFSNLQASFTITDVKDFEQYGLTEPVETIQITAGTQTYSIKLGTFSTMDSQRYMTLGSGKVFMTEEDPYDTFGVDLNRVIQYEAIPRMLHYSSSVAFTGDYDFTITADPDIKDAFTTVYNGKTIPLYSLFVTNYLTLTKSLQFEGFATYKADEEDLSVYGMDDPDLNITYHYLDEEDAEQTFTLRLSENPAAVAAREAAIEAAEDSTAEDEKKSESKSDDATDEDADEETEEIAAAYARIGDSPIIYEISATTYKNMMNSSMDHFRPTAVVNAAWKDLTQLDIVLDETSYTFTTEVDEEEVITWYYNGEEIDTIALKAGFDDLDADSFTPEEPTLKEEIRFTAHAADDSSTEVAFYRYDGDYCLAVIDGTPTSLVSREVVVEFIEAILDIVL